MLQHTDDERDNLLNPDSQTVTCKGAQGTRGASTDGILRFTMERLKMMSPGKSDHKKVTIRKPCKSLIHSILYNVGPHSMKKHLNSSLTFKTQGALQNALNVFSANILIVAS